MRRFKVAGDLIAVVVRSHKHYRRSWTSFSRFYCAPNARVERRPTSKARLRPSPRTRGSAATLDGPRPYENAGATPSIHARLWICGHDQPVPLESQVAHLRGRHHPEYMPIATVMQEASWYPAECLDRLPCVQQLTRPANELPGAVQLFYASDGPRFAHEVVPTPTRSVCRRAFRLSGRRSRTARACC